MMFCASSFTWMLVYPLGGVSPILMSVSVLFTNATPIATPLLVVLAPEAVTLASPVALLF